MMLRQRTMMPNAAVNDTKIEAPKHIFRPSHKASNPIQAPELQ